MRTLSDAFIRVGASRNVEQSLISVRILDYCGSPALHRQRHRAFTLPEVFHEVARAAAEVVND